MAAAFGAPVTEPDGNSAANTSTSDVPGRGAAVTSEVSCHSVGYGSARSSRGTRTEPTCATRDRSLRSRSTIITFSARSLLLAQQFRPSLRVLGRVNAAGRGALHRPGEQARGRPLEEQLRAGAEDEVAADVEQRVVPTALCVRQFRVTRIGVLDPPAQARGQVALVQRPGGDRVLDTAHPGGERLGAPVGYPVGVHRARSGFDRGTRLGRTAHGEPGHGWVARRGRPDRQGRVEAGGRLVADIAVRPGAAGAGPLHLGQHRGDLRGRGRHHQPAPSAE